MALIDCPDCGAKVSDAAPACPKCSRPMTATTIEQTGKTWKLVQLCGGLATAGGCASLMGAGPENDNASMMGVLFFALGLMLFVGGRLGAWWHHG